MRKILLKKIILILALICMIVLPIFRQTGDYTTSSNIVKCADYDHPDDTITAIGASNKTLLVTESETCDTNFTVPANVTVKFERGGKWTINDGITVTFNGQIEAGLWQVFECSGTGTLAGTPIIKEVFPQWWATGDGTAGTPWVNDCIQSAYDFVPIGKTIFLNAGYYELSAQVTVTKQVNIIGEGRNKTIIITADAHGFKISGASYISIKNLTIDGDAQTDGTQWLSCISISGLYADVDYITLENVEVKNAGYYGIDVFEVNHSLFQNIYAHDNWRHGMHPGNNTMGRNKWNTYRNIYAWNNGVSGFSDRGSDSSTGNIEATYNEYDNIQCWDNADGDTLNAVVIGCQKAVSISNMKISGNDGIGLRLSYLEDSSIVNCTITNNGTYGINIEGSKNLNFTNVIVKNNNNSDVSGTTGIRIENGDNLRFTSCQSYDDRETKLQAYGIKTVGSVGYIELVNCTLTPNAIGAISNGAGAVITVITEKMLARF